MAGEVLLDSDKNWSNGLLGTTTDNNLAIKKAEVEDLSSDTASWVTSPWKLGNL